MSAGATHGKVRTLSNAAGSAISSAGPSIAVQLIGLNAVPQAGDEFQVCLCACVCVFGWWGRGCCGLLEHAQIAVVALVTEAQLAVTPRCRGRLKIGSASPRESLRASFCTAKSCAACSDEAVCDTDRRLPVHLCITSSHCPVALAVAFVAPAASTYVLSPARPTRPIARLAQLLLRRVRGCVLHALLR